MARVLVVTNDFPPKQGGIENYVYQLVRRLAPERVVVFTSSAPGGVEFDRSLPFPVIRARAKVLLPTRHVVQGAETLIRRFGCEAVYFGAAASLGLMGSHLRKHTPVQRLVGSTHSHECFWTKAPPTRRAIRALGESMDHLTYISAYCRDVIGAALTPAARERMVRLSPGVDPDQFQPTEAAKQGAVVAKRLGIQGRPTILSVSRLVPHKGQDTLIRAFPRVLAAVPRAELVLVGEGPQRQRLATLAQDLRVDDAVHLVGGVPHAQIAPYYAAADVFAFPTRDRSGGLQVEGLGMVALEAAAAGLPVVVGDSGGAPETVRHGETGFQVPSLDHQALADRLIELLSDPERAQSMGAAGRSWMVQEWTWDQRAQTLATLL